MSVRDFTSTQTHSTEKIKLDRMLGTYGSITTLARTDLMSINVSTFKTTPFVQSCVGLLMSRSELSTTTGEVIIDTGKLPATGMPESPSLCSHKSCLGIP